MISTENILIVLLVLSVIGLGLFLFFFSQSLVTGNRLKKMGGVSRRNKKKYRRLKEERSLLNERKISQIKIGMISLVLGVSCGLGGLYMKHYIATNMSSEDTETVVNGYYLIRDFEEQIELAGEGTEDQDKLSRNIKYLANTMASYALYSANPLNSEEGQLGLNRYYKSIQELGINHSVTYNQFYGNPEAVEETKKDIEKIKKTEKKVYSYFGIDETALKEK